MISDISFSPTHSTTITTAILAHSFRFAPYREHRGFDPIPEAAKRHHGGLPNPEAPENLVQAIQVTRAGGVAGVEAVGVVEALFLSTVPQIQKNGSI